MGEAPEGAVLQRRQLAKGVHFHDPAVLLLVESLAGNVAPAVTPLALLILNQVVVFEVLLAGEGCEPGSPAAGAVGERAHRRFEARARRAGDLHLRIEGRKPLCVTGAGDVLPAVAVAADVEDAAADAELFGQHLLGGLGGAEGVAADEERVGVLVVDPEEAFLAAPAARKRVDGEVGNEIVVEAEGFGSVGPHRAQRILPGADHLRLSELARHDQPVFGAGGDGGEARRLSAAARQRKGRFAGERGGWVRERGVAAEACIGEELTA